MRRLFASRDGGRLDHLLTLLNIVVLTDEAAPRVPLYTTRTSRGGWRFGTSWPSGRRRRWSPKRMTVRGSGSVGEFGPGPSTSKIQRVTIAAPDLAEDAPLILDFPATRQTRFLLTALKR